jgi:hypothetical protein
VIDVVLTSQQRRQNFHNHNQAPAQACQRKNQQYHTDGRVIHARVEENEPAYKEQRETKNRLRSFSIDTEILW